ncbi:MAG: non-canonical purine NTP pyrophosphatase [Spirochaetes bacterium]|nr:non-canonical purine NTP pyrophosphatase [Spirochaetota bacterium]
MKIYFLTGNNNKFKEIESYIGGLEQLNAPELPEIQSLDINEIIKYKLLSARQYVDEEDFILLVEDTGLYLKAMNGFPGPLIKFMLKSIGNEGIFNICDKLCDYRADAITSFGFYNSITDDISFYSSTITGIISAPRGDFGFGWDKIFIPEGAEKTFAEMETIEEKNLFSMRAKALNKLLKELNKYEKA